MAQPKKRTSIRKQGLRRSHLVLKLARQVNKTSPVKAYTTRRESGKRLSTRAKVDAGVNAGPADSDKTSKSNT